MAALYIFILIYFIRVSYKLSVSASNFVINCFEEVTVFGQYGISTKANLLRISNKLGGIIISSSSLDF